MRPELAGRTPEHLQQDLKIFVQIGDSQVKLGARKIEAIVARRVEFASLSEQYSTHPPRRPRPRCLRKCNPIQANVQGGDGDAGRPKSAKGAAIGLHLTGCGRSAIPPTWRRDPARSSPDGPPAPRPRGRRRLLPSGSGPTPGSRATRPTTWPREARPEGHPQEDDRQERGGGGGIFTEAVEKLQKASDAYDATTHHGQTEGTDLDTSIS